MSVLDKLQFWKKEAPPESPAPASENPFTAQNSNPFAEQSSQQGPSAFEQQQDPFASQPPGSDPFAPQQQMQQPLGGSQYSMTGQQQMQTTDSSSSQYGGELHKKDIELVLSRLDLIKSEIDNVQHRLAVIEQNMQRPKW